MFLRHRPPRRRRTLYHTRAQADWLIAKSQVAGLVRSYLGAADPQSPQASPLYGDLSGAPPVRVHVGDDEVLLDASRRYVERAIAAGVDAMLDVWMGSPHGSSPMSAHFRLPRRRFKASGEFLAERLRPAG